MKSKTKAQLQTELSELNKDAENIRYAAGRLRRDVFELGLSPQDRGAVIALIDTFMNKLRK